MKKIYLIIAYLLTLATYVASQSEITVKDDDLTEIATTWTADNIYILDGYVFVEAGGILTIEPGTVIKGLSTPTTGDPASALIISRGASILAEGTASDPIIFTTSLDDVAVADDLDPTDRGLWGGVVILGKAPGGFKNEANEFNIEGIPTEGFGDKALYGGNDAADNSGVLKYVSIRHGGAAIAPDNEINGLTLGSVGSATTIEYVEIFANEDDGIEWFGGTVSAKYLVAAFCGDEAFDYDQSWGGKGQFLFSITGDDTGERGYEIDGSEAPSLNPKTSPVFSNVTQIGSGSTASVSNNDAFRMKSDGAGKFYNSIWTEFSGSSIRIDDVTTFERFQAGDILFSNNVWYNFGNGGNDLSATLDIRAGDPAAFASHLANGKNRFADPQLRGISRTTDRMLDPRPAINASILNQATDLTDEWFSDVAFLGAFGSENWALGWSALSAYGILGELEISVPGEDLILKDEDISENEALTLTANNTYTLDGYVFVESGAVLTIEPGTVIKGLATPTTNDPASALIISRGGKILAEGTAAAPIIFTSSLDDTELSDDLDPTDRGLWGGVVILGNAPGGFKNESLEFNIEGIPTEGYGDRALYGGSDPADNSGIFKYVSIRHGGAAIAPDNEINGLTLGSVGSGTIIEYVEIFANEDDGIEWFGGTVNGKYLVSAFCGDEAFDYDQSWGGKGQFLFSIAGDDIGERGYEIDGSEAPSLNPKTSPIFSNVTQIGSGSTSGVSNNDAFRMKSDGAGKFHNSIWTEFSGSSIRIDDATTFDRFQGGDILFTNNVWYNFGNGGNDLAATLDIRDGDPAAFARHLTDGENLFIDPQLRGISRNTDGQLDPRPARGARILNQGQVVEGDFFDQVSFIGAFGESNWADGWTALSEYGIFGALEVTDIDYQNAISGLQITTENPVQNTGFVTMVLPNLTDLELRIFSLNGSMIDRRLMGKMQSGVHTFEINVSRFEPGLYVLVARTTRGSVSTKLSILR